MAALAKWCGKPLFGGFTELDEQIVKFRQLKEAYSGNGNNLPADRRALTPILYGGESHDHDSGTKDCLQS
jgi:hypothetical protein